MADRNSHDPRTSERDSVGVSAPHTEWRLKSRPPGHYRVSFGGRSVEFTTDHNGRFSLPTDTTFPMYIFATLDDA
jgi:hypothetical protein